MSDKRIAMVTGSTSGIGLQCARRLAARSCDLVITGAMGNQALIGQVLEELRSKYPDVRVDYVEADLTRVADIDAMCARIKELHPTGVDILVNNAGLNHVADVVDFADEKWDEMLAVMLSAPFHLTKRLLPDMKKKGWGRIVNMSSQMGLISSPGKAVYSAVKHGLVGLAKASCSTLGLDQYIGTHALGLSQGNIYKSFFSILFGHPNILLSEPSLQGVALEVGRHGITCNAVCPGFAMAPVLEKQIEVIAEETNKSTAEVTESFAEKAPTGQIVTTDQIAELVEFLCFSGASVNMTGACYLLDQGYTAQ